jgi:uncharacterized damage-inducible protein DinB
MSPRQESAEQYVARIFGYVGDQDPLAVIERTPQRLADLTRGLNADRLDYRPSPEVWSIRQQVAHLADAELIMTSRMRWGAAQPGQRIVGFDQDKWAATGKYSRLPIETSLATFTVVRGWTLAFLRQLSPEEHTGWIMHEERGKETVPHLVRMMAGHDLNHLNQMTELASLA